MLDMNLMPTAWHYNWDRPINCDPFFFGQRNSTGMAEIQTTAGGNKVVQRGISKFFTLPLRQ